MVLLAVIMTLRKMSSFFKRHLLLLPIAVITILIANDLLRIQGPYVGDSKSNSDLKIPLFTDSLRYSDMTDDSGKHQHFSSIKNPNSNVSKIGLNDYPSFGGLMAPFRIEIDRESPALLDTESIELENTILSRNYKLEKVCQSENKQLNYSLKPQEFFINDEYKVIWCNIFKSASTSWIYNFLKMKNLTEKEITRRATNGVAPLTFARHNFYPRPSLKEVGKKLRSKNYVSFVIVREPLRRLLSSYVNKIKKPSMHYADLKCEMVASFGIVRRRVCNPTFSEFVSWVINGSKTKKGDNEHWVSYAEFCSPCKAQFTYLLHFENLRKEQNFLVQKIPKLKKVGINRRMSSGEKIDDELFDKYLKELSANQIHGLLHDVYNYDYEMFGYPTDIYDKYSYNPS